MTATPASEIRRASAEDAHAVAQLLHDFNTEYEDFTPGVPALTERLAELLAAGEIVVLLAAAERPVGFALLRLRPSLWAKAEDTYLEELYVVPTRRGEGIGGRLLDTSIELARQLGANHFELTTGEDDRTARALYESRKLTNREGSPTGPRMLITSSTSRSSDRRQQDRPVSLRQRLRDHAPNHRPRHAAQRPLVEGHRTISAPGPAAQRASGGGAPDAPPPQDHSLRKPGTSMSSSETRSLRMSVSSAEIRGRLS
jgi:GNAT superfamily N-acetyltransferase